MNMNRARRLEEIRKFILGEGEASVDDICVRFKTSAPTIRRSLKDLEDRGLIVRTRGGAKPIPPVTPEPHVLIRAAELTYHKEAIARVAVKFVQEGDTVFLGSGSTVLAVAKLLMQYKNLTVISNSLPVINLFANHPTISVIVLGGLLRNAELSMIGHLTEQSIKELRADFVIAGIRAIDPATGLANDYLPETVTDRAIVHMSQKVVIVADHTKFGRVATSFVAPFSMIHSIITDWAVDQGILHQVRATGVDVLVAESPQPHINSY